MSFEELEESIVVETPRPVVRARARPPVPRPEPRPGRRHRGVEGGVGPAEPGPPTRLMPAIELAALLGAALSALAVALVLP